MLVVPAHGQTASKEWNGDPDLRAATGTMLQCSTFSGCRRSACSCHHHRMEVHVPDPRPNPSRIHIADRSIRGRKFRVARFKSPGSLHSRPLLFFTGIGANIELLAPFLEQVHGREVVTFDMPGIGGSEPFDSPYRLSAMVAVAAEILDDLGIDKVDVMGVSWGGMLAQEFAYRRPERAGRLVLAATTAGFPVIPGKLSSLVKMATSHRYVSFGEIDSYLHSLYGGRTAGLEDYASRIRPPTSRGYLHQLLALAGWTSLRKLTCVKTETLILMGKEDRLVPPANGEILKFLLQRAELEMVKDGGHLFVLTHLEEVANRIEAFLDAPLSAPSSPQPGWPGGGVPAVPA
jgi:poly(3-hydroxyalkanoate) depolymerase